MAVPEKTIFMGNFFDPDKQFEWFIIAQFLVYNMPACNQWKIHRLTPLPPQNDLGGTPLKMKIFEILCSKLLIFRFFLCFHATCNAKICWTNVF